MSGALSVVHPAARVLLGQLVVTTTLAAVVWLFWGQTQGVSLLMGGGIAALSTASMALVIAKQGTSSAAGRAVWGFVIGWLVKVMLTVTLLIMAFRSRTVAPLSLLIGYAATYVAYWWAAARQRR